MDQHFHVQEQITAFCGQMKDRTLPRWEEIPDLELYMDQVLNLTRRYLQSYPESEENRVTSSMVNNYVKAGLLPPPVRKRYNAEHVARLFMICILKNSLPIAMIKKIFDDRSKSNEGMPDFYNGFCDTFEKTFEESVTTHLSGADDSVTDIILCAALRAHAEQSLALKLCADGLNDSDG